MSRGEQSTGQPAAMLLSRRATARLGSFSVGFAIVCRGSFVALDSEPWMVALGVAMLATALLRTLWFLARPPWQVRWTGPAGPIEIMAVSTFGRRRRSVEVADLLSVGPVRPYGAGQETGAALALRIGRLLGVSEDAIRTRTGEHRVIGLAGDLDCAAIRRLSRA